jgi:parallel beta-helix repeat protein
VGKGLRKILPVVGVLGVLTGAWAAVAALGDTPVAHLYVSPRGSDRGRCSRKAPCRTISRAVSVARAGDQINVSPGVYREEVRLTKRLTIIGSHAPEVQAKGHARGFLIKGAGGAGSVVRGFVIEGAKFEGILALNTQRVTIANNQVRYNDRGYFTRPFVGECAPNGIPQPHAAGPPQAQLADERAGGCGEGIHLASTSNSRVTGNLLTNNTGGIYLTDESAPAAHNLVAGNVVEENLYDCGITLASHSSRAVGADGRTRPDAGGVYDNTITHNVSNYNGLRVPGAGILVAAAFTGSAAYDNRITDNRAADNGLPGVALHSHQGGQDLNGNVILNNVIGHNALGGRTGGPGDGDGGVHHTTGILIWSYMTQLSGIRISGNRLGHDYFGIWTEHVPRIKRSANRYSHVRVPLYQRYP